MLIHVLQASMYVILKCQFRCENAFIELNDFLVNVKPFVNYYWFQNYLNDAKIAISPILWGHKSGMSTRVGSLPEWSAPCPDMIMIDSYIQVAFEELCDKLSIVFCLKIYLIFRYLFFDWLHKKHNHLK